MPIAMFYNNGAGYTHCRSGSDSVIHRRSSVAVGLSRDVDVFDSGDSTLSDLDESESGSGSACSGASDGSGSAAGTEGDPNLPYPGIAPIALGYLSQTTRPRSWCLALISNPYPFYTKRYFRSTK
ncbi:voltage-dependent T-type calcium channel subunit alpha-1G-like [Euwallacea similis]|uniref:voltage-dependent T-type calcium channel subunit alpha-1G-like n=1 Tax=Euwallacea similis TaxID=1736056 RepID=UPI00344EDD5A